MMMCQNYRFKAKKLKERKVAFEKNRDNKKNGDNNMKKIVLGLLLLLVHGNIIAIGENSETFNTISIITERENSVLLRSIAMILKRQITQRCECEVEIMVNESSQSQLNILLSIQSDIGNEGFRIKDGESGSIKIIGGDTRGVLYGVGKFLRTSRFDHGGFTPGKWRGESLPKGTFRAVYLATHFQNYYEAAPIEEIKHYIEDLGLWGYNTILVHYPTWQFDSIDDPTSQKWLERFTILLAHAKKCGLKVGLLQVPNQGFKTVPQVLRGVRVPGHRRGNHGVNLCPSKPEAKKMLIELYEGLLDEFKNVGLDYFEFWPYDEGGCACEQCWPWGARGYLEISKAITKKVRSRFPHCKIVLSTWCFENEDDKNPDGEWIGLEKSMEEDNSWVDYIMADGHDDYFPKYLLEQGIPGQLPLVNFPEISMFGMSPWGGYGANPAPTHFQKLWSRIKNIAVGGAPYSEGIYEDINKAIFAGFYWNPERKAEDIIKEYISFEFSPVVVDDLLEVVRIFEQNHNRSQIKGNAIRAFELVTNSENRLTEEVKNSWRWRIFYLRALIDKEIFERNGKIEGEILKTAFDELTKIYYAENAHSMPIRPLHLK